MTKIVVAIFYDHHCGENNPDIDCHAGFATVGSKVPPASLGTR